MTSPARAGVKLFVGRWRRFLGVFSPLVIGKGQIPLRYLVADRSEAGRRPAASWNLAYRLVC